MILKILFVAYDMAMYFALTGHWYLQVLLSEVSVISQKKVKTLVILLKPICYLNDKEGDIGQKEFGGR